MGIWIADVENIKINGEKLIKEKKTNKEREKDEDKEGFISIDINKENNGFALNPKLLRNNDKFNIPNGFDIMFFHQSIFDDKVFPKIEEKKEKFIYQLKENIPYIIFHSGRGQQKEKLPKNVSFLEYSVLQHYILMEPSKFFLTLLAMSTGE